MNREGKAWVTGASGYVGRALVSELALAGRGVVAVTRGQGETTSDVEHLALGDLAEFSDSSLLSGVDCLIHLAGLAHVPTKSDSKANAIYIRANRDSTSALAKAAVHAGVRRFVLISSIHVLGTSTESTPLDDDSSPAPNNAYARSKLAAEHALVEVARGTSLDYVILRPPLVYGPHPKGNLATLSNVIRRGLPLPLGAIHNRRSFIGLGNLVDLIRRCIDAPAVANGTYVVSDSEVVSTTQLVRSIAAAVGTRPLLVPVPGKLLSLAATAVGRARLAEQLFGDLVVDSSRIRTDLGWKQPYTFEQGIATLGNATG